MVYAFFQVNEPVVFFIYGLAFFMLGLSVALQTRKYSRLEMAQHLPWLAVFGITHGLTEWGYLFIPIQARYLSPSAIQVLDLVQLGLMAFSFVALFQFGLNLVVPKHFSNRWRWAPTVAMVLLWGGILILNNLLEPFTPPHLRITGEIWVRILLGFPGSLLSAWGFLRQSRKIREMGWPHIAPFMSRLAFLFVAYGLLSGLITPPHDILWTRWLHDRMLDNILGLPIPFFRSLIGIGMAYFIRLSQEIFVMETDRQLETAKRQKYEVADRDRKILNAVALTVTRPLKLPDLLDDALHCVLAELKLPAGWINMPGSDGELQTTCRQGLSADFVATTCEAPHEGCLCRQVMETRQALTPEPGHQCLHAERSEMGKDQLVHSVAVPLVARDNALGVLNLTSAGQWQLVPEESGLLTAIGRQIGVAVENARLYKELRRKDALRGQLLDKVITAQEEERRRIARELHDQLGQDLSGLSMNIGAATAALPARPERAASILRDTSEIVAGTLGTLRSLILDLRPAALDDLGLAQALRRYGGYVSLRSGMQISIVCDNQRSRLPPQVETAAFRITQEALINASLHSQGSEATVDINHVDSHLQLVVSDNGKGFAPETVLPPDENGRGWGLLGMQERAALFGGTVAVESAPGQGTRIVVDIPLENQEGSS